MLTSVLAKTGTFPPDMLQTSIMSIFINQHQHISFDPVSWHHRLNGSSSHVLTATSLSYGKAKNLTPPQNQNPWSDWDKIWHSWLRRVDDPSRKMSFKSAQGGLWANRWNIRKNFCSCTYTFFSETHLQVRPLGGFLRAMAQTMRSCAKKCLLEIKKFEINI